MRVTARLLAMVLAAVWMFGPVAPVAGLATDMCPMGGAMIMAETDRDRALAWARTRTRVAIDDDARDWSVLALSVGDEGIAVLIEPGQVFFGVAGRGGETYPRHIERAFGAGFEKLKEAVTKTLSDLMAAGVVKIEAADVQAIAGASGLGALEKDAGGWTLKTRECQAVDLPVSGL